MISTVFIVGISVFLIWLKVLDSVLEPSIQFCFLFFSLQSGYDLWVNLFLGERLRSLKTFGVDTSSVVDHAEKDTIEVVLGQYLRFLFAPTPWVGVYRLVFGRYPIAGGKSRIYIEFSLTDRLQLLVSAFGAFFTLCLPFVFCVFVWFFAIVFGFVQKIEFATFWLAFFSSQLLVAGLCQASGLVGRGQSRSPSLGCVPSASERKKDTLYFVRFSSPGKFLRQQWDEWCEESLITCYQREELDRNLGVFFNGAGKVSSESIYAFDIGASSSAKDKRQILLGRLRAKVFFSKFTRLIAVPAFPGTGCNLFLIDSINGFTQLSFDCLSSRFYRELASLRGYTSVDCSRDPKSLTFFNE